jgi:hypothetical protein
MRYWCQGVGLLSQSIFGKSKTVLSRVLFPNKAFVGILKSAFQFCACFYGRNMILTKVSGIQSSAQLIFLETKTKSIISSGGKKSTNYWGII